jgi:hypothetical protein
VTAQNTIDYIPATPDTSWTNPADITYGTQLSSTQLDATASFQGSTLAGSFAYDQPAGTVLSAGSGQTLTATFTPSDATDFTIAAASTTINVLAANSTTTLTLAAGSANPAAYAAPVSFTATVAPVSPASTTPTGSVQFKVDGVNVGTPVTLVNGAATSAAMSNLASGNRQITALYTPDNGNFNGSTSNSLQEVIKTGVGSWSVNGGAIQRSRVISITAVFTQKVLTLDPGAFTLQTSTGGAVAATITPVLAADGLSATLSFSGTGVTAGSLADGRYVITAHATAIHDLNGNTMGADQTFSFFRFFGDSSGDATVNGTDYRAFFLAYLQTSPSAGYNAAFDINGDGTINGTDYRAFFKNYLQTLP